MSYRRLRDLAAAEIECYEEHLQLAGACALREAVLLISAQVLRVLDTHPDAYAISTIHTGLDTQSHPDIHEITLHQVMKDDGSPLCVLDAEPVVFPPATGIDSFTFTDADKGPDLTGVLSVRKILVWASHYLENHQHIPATR